MATMLGKLRRWFSLRDAAENRRSDLNVMPPTPLRDAAARPAHSFASLQSETRAAALRDAGSGLPAELRFALNKREIERFFRARGFSASESKRVVSTLTEYAERIDHER